MSRSEKASFKGNKAFLPSKTCLVCGKEMTWRKSWAKNWDEVNIVLMLVALKSPLSARLRPNS